MEPVRPFASTSSQEDQFQEICHLKTSLCILKKLFAYPQEYKYPSWKATEGGYSASLYRHVGEETDHVPVSASYTKMCSMARSFVSQMGTTFGD